MTGCVALRKDVYYVRLSYYDKDHIRKDKFVSTGLSGRGAKQKATAMIDSLIEKYSYLEKSDHPAMQKGLFTRLRERDMDTEALRKRHKLLHSIVTVNVIALTI